MNNKEYEDKIKTRIGNYIPTFEKQIFSEDSNFILSLRRIMEALERLLANRQNEFKYKDVSQDEWVQKKQIINYKEKKELNKIFVKLSSYVHFSLDSKNEEFSLFEIKKIVSILNKILKSNDMTEIKLARYGKLPEKFYLHNFELVSIRTLKWNDILLSNYEIPMYQRRYDWKHNNIIKLYDDIVSKDINLNNKNYDLGIIYITDKNEIVDGQQRIHSMFIISKIINKIYKENNFEFNYFSIKRKRGGENWRTDFSLLNEEIKKCFKKNKVDHDIERTFDYIEDSFLKMDETRKERVFERITNVIFSIKKISHKDGVIFFNKLNNEGKKLEHFESALTQIINRLSLKEDDPIYDLWVEIDNMEKKQKNFINNFIKFNLEKIKDKEFNECISNLITKIKTKESLCIHNLDFDYNENNIEYFKILLKEIMIDISSSSPEDRILELINLFYSKDDFLNKFYKIILPNFIVRLSKKYVIPKKIISYFSNDKFFDDKLNEISNKELEIFKNILGSNLFKIDNNNLSFWFDNKGKIDISIIIIFNEIIEFINSIIKKTIQEKSDLFSNNENIINFFINNEEFKNEYNHLKKRYVSLPHDREAIRFKEGIMHAIRLIIINVSKNLCKNSNGKITFNNEPSIHLNELNNFLNKEDQFFLDFLKKYKEQQNE